MTPVQLPLQVQLDDDARLDNFHALPQSPAALALQATRQLVAGTGDSRFVYLWGATGSGCSHLLQAASAAIATAGGSTLYLPLDVLGDCDPQALFEGLEQLSLLCLDRLDSVAGRPDWDRALFHFFNRWRDTRGMAQAGGHHSGADAGSLPGCRLLVAARCSPRELSSSLPDLVSRMAWGLTLHLQVPGDDDKKAVLGLRAQTRGLQLSEDVLDYVLAHAPRDMAGLMACLDRLDSASLTERRRVTIPLVRQTMQW